MKPYHVLFLCTGNSARSILAEAYLNTAGRGRFSAHSAGSQPAGRVNPYATELLRANGIATTGLRSKNWDEFAKPGAPQFAFIFTVCDHVAGEACPVWPGQPVTAHWGTADPAAARGTDEDKRHAFRCAFSELTHRIDLFMALPFDRLDAPALKARVQEIGTSRAAGKSR